jgi:membrane-associated HD superfamily phosphohydrolase
MSYFLEKARRSTDPTLQYVREEEFRYPGPKPRTPEAAIFMLADAVEAAARAVSDPTPERLRAVIRQVTDAVVLDRQLDECDLTFADLERIQDAFLTTLLGTHHHRPQYPGFSFDTSQRAAGDAVRRTSG